MDQADETLMLAYAAGDPAAFTRLYDRHERPVHRFFLRQGASPALADDLLQDTWMAVVRSAARYRPEAKFTTWLYRVARSKLIDHWRASGRQVLLDDAANDPDAIDDDGSAIDRVADSDDVRPDVRAISRQQASSFMRAVEALPATQREAFVLHHDGERTLDEIAQITDVGIETVKSRLRYAMKKLRASCADWLPMPSDRPVIDRSRAHDES